MALFLSRIPIEKRNENVESIRGMLKNMSSYGLHPQDVPVILQYNKRDLVDTLSIEELDDDLRKDDWPRFEAVAVKGEGVLDTIRETMKAVLRRFS
jgi:signal recognition particle receptor subunit beta